MATKRKSNGGRGITLYGVVLGLLLGLAAAVAVALFVTQVPMPFTDKASRKDPTVLLPDVRDAPDPNQSLHGRTETVPGTGVNPSATPPAPPAKAPGTESDNLGDLIARLGQQTPPAPAESQVATPKQVATPSPPVAPAPPPQSAGKQGTYYLQAGAFRSTSDAEAMKARLLMLGMSAQIEAAQINGTTLHRVRVGPFQGLDEMNKARSRLGSEKIETSVVRQ